ncbi:hypothetical protein Goklo_028918 [Gossypium klotzschianum]|uniref:SWIM-type domain-containing protein n=1 Tax=Gossypium klotzschianum TaxID=34286 RepID=A0A7J8U2U1_9ROSI|nr:hypothetical protein [Gossypium klotzschianum]
MEIVKSILDIPVQDPQAEFSSADLTWKKFGTVEHQDDVALIPYTRVNDFIIGECCNVECPTRFHIERGRKRSKGSVKGFHKISHIFYCIYEDIGVPLVLKSMGKVVGIPKENVLGKNIECIQLYCGSDATFDTLASEYVRKLGMIIKRSTHELDRDDQASIRMWVERNKKSIFFYQDTSKMDPFILGIQTEWQLQQMVRFGRHNLVAADSNFGIKKLKYPLCTLLVFDSRHHALPVAWIITPSVVKSDMSKWKKALNTFCCPILFSLWRLHSSWLRNVVKKCSNIEVQREIFKRLGKIVYGTWSSVNTSVALEECIQDFVDQTALVDYFRSSWMAKIEMWLLTLKSFPLASQAASGAIEAYHVKLKTKLFDDSHLGALLRVDWLVHKLTTELYSTYWLNRYADESNSFQNVKEEYIASTSWHRALQIPDSAVTLDDKYNLFAKVASLKGSSITHIVWNPGSDFAFCDSAWSMQGNFCKHVIKVNMMCDNDKACEPSMSSRSFGEIPMDLWKKPMDDPILLDESVAWSHQMLDQIKQLVELNSSNDIGIVVNNMPLKWISKKGRKFVGIPASFPALPSTSKSNLQKKNRKWKRLSRLR